MKDKIGPLATQRATTFNSAEHGITVDAQLSYYIMRVADLLKVQTHERISMMGKVVNQASILELMIYPQSVLLQIEDPLFWSAFYRHSNYFLDKNESLLKELALPLDDSIVGRLADMQNLDEAEVKLKAMLFDGKELLSRWGIRATSLSDLIRSMIKIKLELPKINSICQNIAQVFEIDKKIAYKVFKDVEDEFSLQGYTDVDKGNLDRILSVPKHINSRSFGLVSSAKWLEPCDLLEVLLLSKQIYQDFKITASDVVLNTIENLDDDHRKQIWMLRLDPVE